MANVKANVGSQMSCVQMSVPLICSVLTGCASGQGAQPSAVPTPSPSMCLTAGSRETSAKMLEDIALSQITAKKICQKIFLVQIH